MHPRLVICLLLSTIVGIGMAVSAVAAGWGLFVGLVLWSCGGSLCLVAASLIAAGVEDALARIATEQPRARPEPAHA